MKARHELQAGIFIAVVLGLFLISIFTLGRERQLFARQAEFATSFSDVKGLTEGASIRLGGITVGRVSQISFAQALEDSSIEVKLLVDAKFLDRVTSAIRARIETQGLLGDRFIALSSEQTQTDGQVATKLVAGATIPGVESGDIAEVLTNVNKVASQAADITTQVKHIVGTFDENTKTSLAGAVQSSAALLKAIESGEGFLHRLVFSKKDGDRLMVRVDKISQDINAITTKVTEGDGVLHALVFGEGGAATVDSFAQAAKALSGTATSIGEIARKVQEGNGLLNQLLIADTDHGVDEIIKKLDATVSNLKSASEAVAHGSGTLGALLVDSRLYDNLVEVTDDAKRSLILRELIRSSLQKN